jgi:hypothetical protein
MAKSSLSSFRFDQRLTDAIESIKEESGAASKAEVVRRAIALLKAVEDNKGEDGKLMIVHEGQDGGPTREQQIILP